MSGGKSVYRVQAWIATYIFNIIERIRLRVHSQYATSEKGKESDLQKPLLLILSLQHVTLTPNCMKLNPDICSHVDKFSTEL